MKKSILSLLGLLAVAGGLGGPLPPADVILGTWNTYDDQGKVESRVEIYKEKDTYSGRIVSLTEPNWPAGDDQGMAGKPKNDRYNPDPALRSRPIAGLRFMHDFTYNPGKNIWENGRIYDPGCGKTYKCKMTLASQDRLDVRGYIGISLLGRTETWTR